MAPAIHAETPETDAPRRPVIQLVLAGTPGVSRQCPDHLRFLEARGHPVYEVALPWVHPLKRLPQFLKQARRLSRAELILTDEYFNAALVSALLRLTRSRARHAVLGLNVSGNRRLRSGFAPLDRLLDRLFFGRVDMAVVASKPEADLFAAEHGIPRDRFAFVRWSYDLPELDGHFAPPARPYFCLIGRNNRDHETFCAALEGLEAEGVIIAHTPPELELPPNVRAYVELPLGDCIACIRQAVANVILVRDADRGAGHITIVTAMHCARPQIISDVETALDYFTPGEHALTVPLADPAAVRAAMQSLMDDPERADRMGRAARDYAARELTHARRSAVLEQRLRHWLDTEEVLWAPEDETRAG